VEFRFNLNSANVLFYLGSRIDDTPPRLTYPEIDSFLNSLSMDHDPARPRMLSTDHQWVNSIRGVADNIRDKLRNTPHRNPDETLDSALVERLLNPLAEVLERYDLYILPVGTWRDSEVLDRFAHEAAQMPGHETLVLIPDYYDGLEDARILDPLRATMDTLKNRDLWPGALFILRSGVCAFLPMDDAYLRLTRLAAAFSGAPGQQRMSMAENILSKPSRAVLAARSVRIAQLSDLHFGTSQAAEAEMYLLSSLSRMLPKPDHIVITGDLFDQPRKRYAQQYRNFSHSLQLLSGAKPIVVPGNHDQRVFGNDILGIGQRLRELADLDWQPLRIDHGKRIAFFCFDSSRTGDFARGRVDGKQLLRMATQFDVENQAGALDGYMKIALVHHHPYPYPYEDTSIIDPRSWAEHEKFLELRGSEEFLSWCAGRSVSLILHGHKHVPRLIINSVSSGGNDRQPITTVGCGSSLGAGGSCLSYNIIEWRPDSQFWSVDFQIDRGDGQGFRSAAVTVPNNPSIL
jgi:predicted MPP superfamily phosphohydrolase